LERSALLTQREACGTGAEEGSEQGKIVIAATDNPEPNVLREAVDAFVCDVLSSNRHPSAWELLEEIEVSLDWKARWMVKDVLLHRSNDSSMLRSSREYLDSLLSDSELDKALAGTESPRKEVVSGIDSLIRQGSAYRTSKAFQEMIDFMGRFRDYAPYNNMLVRIQNPSCSFYATEKDWSAKFERLLNEDARPMLILAPMHPVMLVYELDQTHGKELPKEVTAFATFEGEWDSDGLSKTIDNAGRRDLIRVDVKRLSSTNAGFATIARGDNNFKMRIALHDDLNSQSRYGVLCHELAHIYLGHLGTDKDHWWPSRTNLDHKTVEIEAEAVAFLVTSRAGLTGSSASYVCRHMSGGNLPASVSLDLIAKVAGRIEEMGKRVLEPRRPSRKQKPQMELGL
jgi:hypothetical protein